MLGAELYLPPFYTFIWVLKIILSNTNSLCQYLQEKMVDVISTRRNANITIQTLCQYQSVGGFYSAIWQIYSISNGSENEEMTDQFSVWITSSHGTQIHNITQPFKPLKVGDKCSWQENIAILQTTSSHCILMANSIRIPKPIKMQHLNSYTTWILLIRAGLMCAVYSLH